MRVAVALLAATSAVTHALNYSSQLMEALIPKGWTPEQWAGATDDMITKTNGKVGCR